MNNQLTPAWLGTLKKAMEEKQIEWINDSQEVLTFDQYYFPDVDILANRILEWAGRKQFDTPTDFSDATTILSKLMLVVSELGEAAEAVRKQDPQNFSEELADTIIRILHLCGGLQIPISEAINQKMQVNEKRPIKHGKATSV